MSNPYGQVKVGGRVIRFHMAMKGGILSMRAVTDEDIQRNHARMFDYRAWN